MVENSCTKFVQQV